ncbi:hypothetical protein [Bifidobacterium eulemuris]|uniref:Uncharacterized protein n=1 Tax=Bifidobacterium eulemuris TaxID=1765219 RepID=A0A261G9V2_9BIFI|nr:hypothetical protein [Bifidobacterium eulemuris]OZG68211.1 hypothetical protein BEUL_1224 [Bifidobacterium eulemuris]QOL31732.1 hypothetical protein BE0216_04070 [Bifidobacterium eulemuris]
MNPNETAHVDVTALQAGDLYERMDGEDTVVLGKVLDRVVEGSGRIIVTVIEARQTQDDLHLYTERRLLSAMDMTEVVPVNLQQALQLAYQWREPVEHAIEFLERRSMAAQGMLAELVSMTKEWPDVAPPMG